ncbi:MAG: GGDEF domain-containing protein [Candidatus Pacearchaeota archaeon]
MDWLKKILGQNSDKKEITLDAQKIAKLYYLATVDTKTQLYNYRYFSSEFKHELAISERYGRILSLIIIDIDDFKKINDNYGYLRGDEILQLVATIIKSNIRETDIAARFGGEEFVVLMPETKEEEAEKMAERLRNLIMADKFLFNYGVTVSIGVAQNKPLEKENVEIKSLYERFMPKNKEKSNEQTLFEKANIALRYAKEHGKNKVVAFSKICKNAFLENIKKAVEDNK